MNELVDYEDLKNTLLSVGDGEHKAFLCSVYAGMCRVGEILRARDRRVSPFFCKDVVSFPNKVELHIRTEKSRKMRKVPVFRNREAWLCDVIEGWRNHVGSGAMFPFTTRWGEIKFRLYFPEFSKRSSRKLDGTSIHTVHWLRGWRYTHYKRGEVTGRRVEAKVASLLGGWVSSSVPDRCYDFTEIDDYLEVLENG